MIPCLVIRGEANAQVFRKLLEPEFGRELRVLATDYFSESVSLARSILSHHKSVVALISGIRDSKSENTRELYRFLVYALVQMDCPDMWKVVMVEPDTEAMLFQDRGVLSHVLGREPTEEEWTRGKTDPFRVLEEVVGLERRRLDKELCRRLETVDVSPLAGHPAVQQVREFFRAHREGRASMSV